MRWGPLSGGALTDTKKYKPYLKKYLSLKGIEIKNIDGAQRMRCLNHNDEHPSAIVYAETVHCPVCSLTWDIFEIAGLLCGHTKFPDKLKEVQKTLNISPDEIPPVVKKTQKVERLGKKKTFAVPVPVSIGKANDIFNRKMLTERAIKYKWGTEITDAWPYKNSKGDVILVDIRFQGGEREKNIISFYYDGKNVISKNYPIILFNLDLIATDKTKPILIHEGAKCADAASVLPGFISTAWNGGAKKCQYANWSALQDRDIFIWPDDDEPGIAAAFMIKSKLPHAKIIPPSIRAREIKPTGADIVEVLQIATPEEIEKYILESKGMEPVSKIPPTAPPVGNQKTGSIPDDSIPPSNNDGTTDRRELPFRILGTADDGKAYFLDRHERLYNTKLDTLCKQKLLCLAPRIWWKNQYSYDGKLSWDQACDEMIELAGKVDFNAESVRGRGAWKEAGDKYCYNDGHIIIGDHDPKKLYLKKTQKDIGLSTEPITENNLKLMAAAIQNLSFQTSADAIRCMAWATIAPFGGALPWRPAFLLTGDSGSGKTTVANHIIRPLASPEWLEGGETTVAGVRGSTKNDTEPVIFEEAEAGIDKKGRNREDLFSLMVSSTSDDAPDARKGTKDQGYTNYGMCKMFGFISISTEVESAAALNRLIWINMKRAYDSAEAWLQKEKDLINIMTPENCNGLRSKTWRELPVVLSMMKPIATIIQAHTKKDYRFAYAEAILLSTYFVVWENITDPADKEMIKFIKEFYSWQPPEDKRDETEELIDRLLDESVQLHNSRGVYLPLREILKALFTGQLETGGDLDYEDMKELSKKELIDFKRTAHRYGLGLVSGTSDIAVATNHHEIMRILNRGPGYQRQLWRHKSIVDKNRRVTIAGKTRTCVVLKDIIAAEVPI